MFSCRDACLLTDGRIRHPRMEQLSPPLSPSERVLIVHHLPASFSLNPGREANAHGLSAGAGENKNALHWPPTTSSAQNYTCGCHNARNWNGERLGANPARVCPHISTAVCTWCTCDSWTQQNVV